MKPANDARQGDSVDSMVLSARGNSGVVTAAALGLAAAWIAAGSTGMLAHSLRHGLTWVALALAVIAAWPRQGLLPTLVRLAALAVVALAAVPMIASPLPPLNVLAVSLVMLVLAQGMPPGHKAALLYSAAAVAILGVYRLAYTSIVLVWMGADALAGAMGSAAGLVTARPLWVGATMGGVDYLVPMLFLAVALPLRSRRPAGAPRPYKPLLFSLLAVLGAHFLYLGVVAFAGDVVAMVSPEHGTKIAKGNALVAGLARVVPWDLPAVAAMLHMVIAWVLFFRFAKAADGHQPKVDRGQQAPSPVPVPWAAGLTFTAVASLLAVAFPVLTVLSWSKPELAGKKIVFYEKGFLNWLKPEHGQYGRLSVGMYGMIPAYMESLGATAVISPDLAEKDLQDADALVIIYPNKPWAEGQLERIWGFVRTGGSLMVMGEHTVQEADGTNRFNDVLEPTAMQVPFDAAEFAIGGWLHSYDAVSHPTTAGMSDEENAFGVVIGASVDARWPARPLLIGRWGWNDWGDEKGSAMLGNRHYNAGEKLGDVVLAAEQTLGAGRVICFGDTSGLTNGLTVTCHDYTSRLYAYLAGGGDTPQAAWRQLAGLAVAVLLACLLIWQPWTSRIAAVALSLGVSLAVCTAVTYRNWTVLPDGSLKTPNNLAYIDGGHLNNHSPESWREDGLGGLHLTLMRNGFLPLVLNELTPERLQNEVGPAAAGKAAGPAPRAGLLMVVAPASEYSPAECKVVEDYVRAGGTLIYTVGSDQGGPSQRLLSTFGFQVGSPAPADKDQANAPRPLGHFKSPFFDGGNYFAYVRFHAAWPVYCDDPQALVVTQHQPGVPVIVVRRVGKGLVAVIGDTCFAMNKNLEREDGSPFEGLRENAVFWRWFLALLRDRPKEMWYPPNPKPESK